MSIFSQEIDFEDLGEEDFAPAPPSSHIHDPAPQVPHNNLDDPPNHTALNLFPANFVVLLLGLQALDMEIRIAPHVSSTRWKRCPASTLGLSQSVISQAPQGLSKFVLR